jgi:hypothetical protein
MQGSPAGTHSPSKNVSCCQLTDITSLVHLYIRIDSTQGYDSSETRTSLTRMEHRRWFRTGQRATRQTLQAVLKD